MKRLIVALTFAGFIHNVGAETPTPQFNQNFRAGTAITFTPESFNSFQRVNFLSGMHLGCLGAVLAATKPDRLPNVNVLLEGLDSANVACISIFRRSPLWSDLGSEDQDVVSEQVAKQYTAVREEASKAYADYKLNNEPSL